jgi:hypothetical protein
VGTRSAAVISQEPYLDYDRRTTHRWWVEEVVMAGWWGEGGGGCVGWGGGGAHCGRWRVRVVMEVVERGAVTWSECGEAPGLSDSQTHKETELRRVEQRTR